jgi:hypothetical protein
MCTDGSKPDSSAPKRTLDAGACKYPDKVGEIVKSMLPLLFNAA